MSVVAESEEPASGAPFFFARESDRTFFFSGDERGLVEYRARRAPQALQTLGHLVAREAETMGFADAYFASGACALVPVTLFHLARRPRPAPPLEKPS